MADFTIPDDVKQFLLGNIDTIAQWEGLLLLRNRPDKEWTAEATAQDLYIHKPEAERLLNQLTERNMLIATNRQSLVSYRYQPQSQELEQIIERTAELYTRYLIPITHIIHSKLKSRVQEFADAFKIRKD